MITTHFNALETVSVMTERQELWLMFPLMINLQANAASGLILTFFFKCRSLITSHRFSSFCDSPFSFIGL